MLKLSSILFILGAAVATMTVHAQQADASMQAQFIEHNAPEALTPEQQAVLRPLQLMCDGLVKKDARLIQDQLLPGGMATQIREGKPIQMTFDLFETRLRKLFETSHDQFKEALYHPAVRMDHDIAVIWAPYVFTVNG
jgi:hypothetical protein